jgi:hypothetical protein
VGASPAPPGAHSVRDSVAIPVVSFSPPGAAGP